MPERPLVLRGARIWDGQAAHPQSGPALVRIEAGRIAGVGEDAALLDDARVWDAPEGAVAIPGLIDAHVHLTLDADVAGIAEQLAIPTERVAEGAAARAAAMLRAGITTARDLGGGQHLELALRDRIAEGSLPGPRLLCAGQPLTTEGGHCHFWGGEVRDDQSLEAVIERQLERGVDWIKVMATGGVNTKGTSVRAAQFDTEALAAMRASAHRAGRSVAAHCHGTAGIRNAAAARLASIEHCSFAGERGFGDDFDPAVPHAIAAAGSCVSPTVNSGWRRFFAEGEGPERFQAAMSRALRALREAGVPLIASTDAGIPNVHHDDLPRALPVFARFAGLSPVEALRTATGESAEALGLADETGRLVPGLAADVVVVRSDPTADLSALADPLLVLARGREAPAPVNPPRSRT